MSSPTYLYGYGNRRHIQCPDKPSGYPLCDKTAPPRYVRDESMVADYRRWNRGEAAESYIRRAREMPICKVCQKGWDRLAQTIGAE
jgi:hypothetical protein